MCYGQESRFCLQKGRFLSFIFFLFFSFFHLHLPWAIF